MFSGLTNQVTSWIGAAKGDPLDEEVPPPVNQASTPPEPVQKAEEHIEQPVAEGEEDPEKKQSPTKAGGMFSNVKSQMSGWLGSASIPSMPAMPTMPSMPAMPSIPSIPGLRKAGGENDQQSTEGVPTDPSLNEANPLVGEGVDEDDKSRYISATEGADSHPASGGGSPTEDQAGQIGNVTTKVTQGAKTFGSFLYSAVNKAGAKIKETVKDNTILGEFNKEQEAFIKGQQNNKAEPSVAPWIGHSNEAKVKEEILSLSQDRRNFVRAPPAGVDFQFDYDVSYPVALAIMAEDSALEKMRFELVPKIITEENFWRNYFYRVSLICQAGDLGTLGTDGSIMGQQSSEEVKTKNSETNSNSNEALKRNLKDQKTNLEGSKVDTDTSKPKSISESEFVSDTFQTTETDLEEVKAGMRKLGIDTMAQQAIDNEEQWEKDLEAELQEYEVVNDGTSGGGGGGSTSTNIRNRSSPSNNDWEQYADLIDETDDLK